MWVWTGHGTPSFRAVADRNEIDAAVEGLQVGRDARSCEGGVGGRASIHYCGGGGCWRWQLSGRSRLSSGVGEVLVRGPQVRRQEIGVAIDEALGGLANLAKEVATNLVLRSRPRRCWEAFPCERAKSKRSLWRRSASSYSDGPSEARRVRFPGNSDMRGMTKASFSPERRVVKIYARRRARRSAAVVPVWRAKRATFSSTILATTA